MPGMPQWARSSQQVWWAVLLLALHCSPQPATFCITSPDYWHLGSSRLRVSSSWSTSSVCFAGNRNHTQTRLTSRRDVLRTYSAAQGGTVPWLNLLRIWEAASKGKFRLTCAQCQAFCLDLGRGGTPSRPDWGGCRGVGLSREAAGQGLWLKPLPAGAVARGCCT